MIVQMIKCDNWTCVSLGAPEEGGTKNKPKPPYGWLTVKGGYYGSGPYFDLVVCSTECLESAIHTIVRDSE